MDVNDFVVAFRDQYPELDNFLGFAEESLAEDIQMTD
jgi:hypothetical protein